MENIIGTYCNNCRLPYCICEIKQPKQVEEIEAVEFAAYLSVNNWESSNGIMYNKFRIEYGSKYIVTTEHIKQLYEIFKTLNNK